MLYQCGHTWRPAMNGDGSCKLICKQEDQLLQRECVTLCQLKSCQLLQNCMRNSTFVMCHIWSRWCLVFLHFARVADDAKYIVVMAICECVCVSLTAFPHYCMDPDVTWGNGRGAPCCALLGRFAICAWVSFLWQHSANVKCRRVLVLTICLVVTAKGTNLGCNSNQRFWNNIILSNLEKRENLANYGNSD